MTVLLFGKPIGHGVYHPGREVVQKSRRHLLQLDLLSTLFNIPVVLPPTTPPGLQVKTLHLPHIPASRVILSRCLLLYSIMHEASFDTHVQCISFAVQSCLASADQSRGSGL